MSDAFLQSRIDYHAARAIEEIERAERTFREVERNSHFELSRLHLDQAGRLVASQSAPPNASVLDMGEASREQGFQLYGCR